MNVAALFSGGKDSVFSIYIAQQYGWDVTHLVAINPQKTDSWMYHSVNIHLTNLLSQALNIPIITKETAGEKEHELQDLKTILESLDIDGVISGAIASEYQRTRIERICHDLHLKSFTPLWHKQQTQLLTDQINAGFHIIIVGVFAHGLTQQWLGKTITTETIKQLTSLHNQFGINTAGEGGEFETFVVDGPIFTKKLQIQHATTRWQRDHGILHIDQITLEEKPPIAHH